MHRNFRTSSMIRLVNGGSRMDDLASHVRSTDCESLPYFLKIRESTAADWRPIRCSRWRCPHRMSSWRWWVSSLLRLFHVHSDVFAGLADVERLSPAWFLACQAPILMLTLLVGGVWVRATFAKRPNGWALVGRRYLSVSEDYRGRLFWERITAVVGRSKYQEIKSVSDRNKQTDTILSLL